MKEITIKEVEYLAHKLAKERLSFNEPIPDFASRFPGKLESCLAIPFQKFEGKSPYPTLLDKAGVLFYLMIKNHPFMNGNKRVAITTLLLLLYKNGKWIYEDPYELYRFTMWIAKSPSAVKDATVQAIRDYLLKIVKAK